MDKYTAVNEILVNLFNDIIEIEQKEVITGEFKNITYNDMHIIEAIGTKKAHTMTSVAKRLRITVGTLTIAINNLVKKGYVDRIRSEEDRRVVLISLTELGKRAYLHHQRFHEEMIRVTLEGIKEEDIPVLTSALSNLSRYFKEKYIN